MINADGRLEDCWSNNLPIYQSANLPMLEGNVVVGELDRPAGLGVTEVVCC